MQVASNPLVNTQISASPAAKPAAVAAAPQAAGDQVSLGASLPDSNLIEARANLETGGVGGNVEESANAASHSSFAQTAGKVALGVLSIGGALVATSGTAMAAPHGGPGGGGHVQMRGGGQFRGGGGGQVFRGGGGGQVYRGGGGGQVYRGGGEVYRGREGGREWHGGGREWHGGGREWHGGGRWEGGREYFWRDGHRGYWNEFNVWINVPVVSPEACGINAWGQPQPYHYQNGFLVWDAGTCY